MTTTVLALDERVALRVVDATAAELRAVAHQTGLSKGSQDTDPALSVRYVDELPLDGPLRLVGPTMGCTTTAVVMLPPASRPGPRTLVPILSVGGRTEVLCERGATTVPLLMDLLNASATQAGLLPLHAGCFVRDGLGTVVTGWSKGGKTETMLGVLAADPQTRFVGDEWVYVDGPARLVLGSAHPMRVWDWQLQQLPELRARLPRRELRRFAVIRRLERLHASWPAGGRRLPPAKLLAGLMPLLQSRHGAYVEPAHLFGADRLAIRAGFDRLVQVESWASPTTTHVGADAAHVAARMTWSLRHERRELTEAYDGFRYVNPGASNPWLDALDGLEERLLTAAFNGIPAVEVRHPYPVDIAALAAVVVAAVS